MTELVNAINLLYCVNDSCLERDKYINPYQLGYLAGIKLSTIDDCLNNQQTLFDHSRFVFKRGSTYQRMLDVAPYDWTTMVLEAAISGDSYSKKTRIPSARVMTGAEIFEFLNSQKNQWELRYTTFTKKEGKERMLAFKVYNENGDAFSNEETFTITLDGKARGQGQVLMKIFEEKGKAFYEIDISSEVTELNKKLKMFKALRAISKFYILRDQMTSKSDINNLLDNYRINHNKSLGKASDFLFISFKENHAVLNVPFQKFSKVSSLSKL